MTGCVFGAFGKMPSVGDFFRISAPNAFVHGIPLILETVDPDIWHREIDTLRGYHLEEFNKN